MTSVLIIISQFVLLSLITILTTKELQKKFFVENPDQKTRFKMNYIQNFNTGEKK